MNTARLAKVVALTGVAVAIIGVALGFSISAALAQTDPEQPADRQAAPGPDTGAGARTPQEIKAQTDRVLAIAIAAVISVSCLAAGYAVGKVGSAAMGAASEKPELMGRALLFVALAEGIAIYGVLAAVLLYTKIGT